MSFFPVRFPTDQGGMVLLFCLLFLTALTLLGLSASAATVIQNQLTANLQEKERARQSASAALSWAEDWLLEREESAPETCSEHCEGLILHAPGTLSAYPQFEDLSWWMEHGHEAGIDPLTGTRTATVSAGSINPPMWAIVKLHEVPPTESGAGYLQTWYRILARGSGRTEAGVSVIESIVTRSWISIEDADAGTTATCPASEASACGRVSWRELR
jgi:Tfp pilus assembly protein PilX